MKKITYTSLLNSTLDLYKKASSLDAYRYITENTHNVKGDWPQIFNFRYSLASASGLEREALEIMKEAILVKNFWYGYEYLLEDEDLKPLHKYEEFHRMAALCREREEYAKQYVEPQLKTVKGNDNNDTELNPLIIALHGNQENVELTEEYWSTTASERYILALPQSSQIQFSDGYVWDDIEQGTMELNNHYDEILKKKNIDRDKVIIGGFSAGGRVALNFILKSEKTANGFVFVAPWLPDLDEWEPLFYKLKDKGIKGYIICGDMDEDCLECTRKFVDLLEKKSIPHIFKLVTGLDHEYPENFQGILKNALEYIL